MHPVAREDTQVLEIMTAADSKTTNDVKQRNQRSQNNRAQDNDSDKHGKVTGFAPRMIQKMSLNKVKNSSCPPCILAQLTRARTKILNKTCNCWSILKHFVSCLRLPSSLIFILLTSSKAGDISFVLLLMLKEAKEVHINLARVVDPASKHQH